MASMDCRRPPTCTVTVDEGVGNSKWRHEWCCLPRGRTDQMKLGKRFARTLRQCGSLGRSSFRMVPKARAVRGSGPPCSRVWMRKRKVRRHKSEEEIHAAFTHRPCWWCSSCLTRRQTARGDGGGGLHKAGSACCHCKEQPAGGRVERD